MDGENRPVITSQIPSAVTFLKWKPLFSSKEVLDAATAGACRCFWRSSHSGEQGDTMRHDYSPTDLFLYPPGVKQMCVYWFSFCRTGEKQGPGGNEGLLNTRWPFLKVLLRWKVFTFPLSLLAILKICLRKDLNRRVKHIILWKVWDKRMFLCALNKLSTPRTTTE